MVERDEVILAFAEPFEIEAGEGEGSGAFVEEQDVAAGEDGEVTIAGGAGFDGAFDGPGLAFVVAELDGDVAAVAGFAIGIGEKQAVAAVASFRRKAGHGALADGFLELGMEGGAGPLGGAVGARGEQAAAGGGFRTGVEEDAAIGEFDGGGFVGDVPFAFAGQGDIASFPGGAVVVRIDRGRNGGAVGVSAGASGDPDGDEQAAGGEADAVAGASGEDLPVIARAEAFEGAGDFAGGGPGDAVVVRLDMERAHVLQAEDEVDGAAGLAGYGDGIVVSDFAGRREVLREGDGVLGFGAGDGGDDALRRPGFAAIGGAAEDDIDGAPVAALALAGFGVGEHGALVGDREAGDAIERVAGIASGEDIRFFEERGRGEKACREEAEQTTEHGNYRILRFSRTASR